MKQITSLTPEQDAMLSVYRDRFIKIGLSCEPADFDSAQEAMIEFYKSLNLKAPSVFLRLRSPAEGIAASMLLNTVSNYAENVEVAGRVNDTAIAYIKSLKSDMVANHAPDIKIEQSNSYVINEVRRVIEAEVADPFEERIPVANSIDYLYREFNNNKLSRNTIRDLFWKALLDHSKLKNKSNNDAFDGLISNILYGQHDAGWVSLYQYFHDVIKIEGIEVINHITKIASSVGWCWTFPDIVVMTDRPELLRRNNNHRLHSAEGPALMYRDGYSLYMWHGYRIPDDRAWFIEEKEKITKQSIMKESNAELRRIMLEISNYAPIVNDARIIAEDKDGNGLPRRLMTTEISGEQVRIVDVTNGTIESDGERRRFFLGAMDGDTPHECIAASYGVAPKKYKEAVRT